MRNCTYYFNNKPQTNQRTFTPQYLVTIVHLVLVFKALSWVTEGTIANLRGSLSNSKLLNRVFRFRKEHFQAPHLRHTSSKSFELFNNHCINFTVGELCEWKTDDLSDLEKCVAKVDSGGLICLCIYYN